MSFSSSDDDSQQRFALGLVFALIALVVTSVVGTVVYKQRVHMRAQAEPAAVVVDPAGTPVVAVNDEVARVVVDGAVVRFYFATGSAAVTPDAQPALADIARAVKGGRSVVVSVSMTRPAMPPPTKSWPSSVPWPCATPWWRPACPKKRSSCASPRPPRATATTPKPAASKWRWLRSEPGACRHAFTASCRCGLHERKSEEKARYAGLFCGRLREVAPSRLPSVAA